MTLSLSGDFMLTISSASRSAAMPSSFSATLKASWWLYSGFSFDRDLKSLKNYYCDIAIRMRRQVPWDRNQGNYLGTSKNELYFDHNIGNQYINVVDD